MVDAEKQILSRGDVLPNTAILSGTCQVNYYYYSLIISFLFLFVNYVYLGTSSS